MTAGTDRSFKSEMEAGNAAMLDGDFAAAVKTFLGVVRAINDRTDPRWVNCRCALAEAAYIADDGTLPAGCDDLGVNVAGLLGITQFFYAGTDAKVAYIEVGRTWVRIASLEHLRADRNDFAKVYWGHAVEMLDRGSAPPQELAPALCCKASFHHHEGGLRMLDWALELAGIHYDGEAKMGAAERLQRWRLISDSALNDPSWSPVASFDFLLAAARDCCAFGLLSAGAAFLRAADDLLAREAFLDKDGARNACVRRMRAECALDNG